MVDEKGRLQERFLLNLDSEPASNLLRRMLKSPLELANEVIVCLFENKFDVLHNKLDGIKKFVAGVTRAEKLGGDSILANFYPSLFAFHQYFHSSYRARQGKTLEEFVKEVFRSADNGLVVPDKLNEKKRAIKSAFKSWDSKADIDVVVKDNNRIMAVQLRSRDDTGGTTAKSSLAEVLRKLLALRKIPSSSLYYHICVWEEIESNQKQITKSKIYDTLEHQLRPLKITRQSFIDKIEAGIEIKPKIFLKLSYGTKEILKVINDWLGDKRRLRESTIQDMIVKMQQWDDLWLAYSITSLELEIRQLKGFDNVEYLNDLLKNFKYNTNKFSKSGEYVILADDLALKLIPLWKRQSIPFELYSDKVQYIRDLIILKLIYENL